MRNFTRLESAQKDALEKAKQSQQIYLVVENSRRLEVYSDHDFNNALVNGTLYGNFKVRSAVHPSGLVS